MTPEEEFVARLTCRSMTAHELWDTKMVSGFIKFRSHRDSYFYATEDVYVTCCNVLLPAGEDFIFAQDDLRDPMLVRLRSRNDP